MELTSKVGRGAEHGEGPGNTESLRATQCTPTAWRPAVESQAQESQLRRKGGLDLVPLKPAPHMPCGQRERPASPQTSCSARPLTSAAPARVTPAAKG